MLTATPAANAELVPTGKYEATTMGMRTTLFSATNNEAKGLAFLALTATLASVLSAELEDADEEDEAETAALEDAEVPTLDIVPGHADAELAPE